MEWHGITVKDRREVREIAFEDCFEKGKRNRIVDFLTLLKAVDASSLGFDGLCIDPNVDCVECSC